MEFNTNFSPWLFSCLIAISLAGVAGSQHDVATNSVGEPVLSKVKADAIDQPVLKSVTARYSAIQGLERDPDGFLRRDNSDIIKVGDLYYVWYSKMRQFVPKAPVLSSVWYATSPDGHVWTEKGECVSTGDAGSWDDLYVYTPGILVAEGGYYLFYTAQSTTGPVHSGARHPGPITAIGVAESDSPDGPWEKIAANPVLAASKDRKRFDSHRVDDSCLIKRDGKYWLYYKGRQWGKGPERTKMGLAIAEKPAGPYVKHNANPVIGGNHEVLVWPQAKGVAAMIGWAGPKDLVRSMMFAEDGIHFRKTHDFSHENVPWAPGAYRSEAFTESERGETVKWGLHIGGKRPDLYLERFDLEED